MTDIGEAPKIGIALSGGGSRAIAFHLGCLRCLHRLGLLQKAKVLSTVSGGSVIGAMWMLHDGSFEAFEARVRDRLREGLVRPTVTAALGSPEGVKALVCTSILVMASSLAFLLKLVGLGRVAARAAIRLRRFASRTTIFRLALDNVIFHGARVKDTERAGRAKWVALATELRTGSAFYFSARVVGSWRFGRALAEDISVAHAVAASAAFPLLLPVLDETMEFQRQDGSIHSSRVALTDGGVYDNLGLAPLWPDRDPSVSLEVDDIDTIIACRAGDGPRLTAPGWFFLDRMSATVAAMHDRAQNATMKRLFDLTAGGQLKSFVLPYLGQNDDRLEQAPLDLIPRAEVINYPTNFSAMSSNWIERLSGRGEQVTLAVLQQHAGHLIDGV